MKKLNLDTRQKLAPNFLLPHGEGENFDLSLRKSKFWEGTDRKRAFTLSEVLVTLGIIGVVSAITLPTLIENYQKKVVVNKLKSTYALLSQATNLAVRDYGEITPEPLSYGRAAAIEASKIYFEPYLKVIKKCDYDNEGECKFERATMSGDLPIPEIEFVYYSNRAQILFLANGSEVLISKPPSNDGEIVLIIDVNGTKKPNTYGKDVFRFCVKPNGQIKPHYSTTSTRENIIKACKGNGIACVALIWLDGWEISKDYPW